MAARPISRYFLLGLVLLVPGLAPGQAAMRFQQAEVVDFNGFEQPMTAMTLLIPAGWRSQGGIRWQPNAACNADATVYDWSASDPSGAHAVMILPAAGWQWNSLPGQYQQSGVPGCPMALINSARHYLEALVQLKRPGAVVLDFRARPDLIANMQSLNSRTPMPMGEMVSQVDAGEILIGYNHGGQAYRESIMAIVVINSSRMSDAMGGTTEYGSGYALPAFAMRAPDGALNFKLFNTLQRSIKANPAWERRMAAHNSKISQIQIKGARERADLTRRTNEEIRQMQQDSWEYQQRVQDRSHQQFSRVIRGVDLYQDPLEGRVELPNTYDRAWRANDGTYIMSDDPNFDPYRHLGVDATELRRIEQ